LANLQLASHVGESVTNVVGPAHNIIDDDFRVGVIIDSNTLLLSLLLPDAVDIMDEIDEGGRLFVGPKGMTVYIHLIASTP
jgi:hypothetical protein